MSKKPLSKIALLSVALLGIPASAVADVYDIYVTGANDKVYYREWGYGGNYTGWIVEANPNQVSHTYSPGSGSARDTSLSFYLSALSSVSGKEITSASFNFNILNVWTEGRDDIGTFSGGGSVLNSGGTGWKSFDVTAGIASALDNSASSISYTLNYTGYSGFTFGSAEGGAPAYLRITTAVPEPETYAMLLAGLGLMGAVARRRRPAQH